MKIRLNPAAIGIFIAGAIVILLASLVLFGSGRFYRKTSELLLTFQEPVTGLEVGAPVKLMGVTVGRVKNIAIENRASPIAVILSLPKRQYVRKVPLFYGATLTFCV